MEILRLCTFILAPPGKRHEQEEMGQDRDVFAGELEVLVLIRQDLPGDSRGDSLAGERKA